MIINFNGESAFASNQSRLQGLNISKAVERLSSGLRINHSADDPSGLGICSGVKAQLRGVTSAIHNVEESIKLYSLRDAYLEGFNQKLDRIRDLAVRASNDATLTVGDLSAMNSEAQKLKDEINRTTMSSYEVDGGKLLFNPGDLDVIWVLDVTGSMMPYANSLYNDSEAMFEQFANAGFDLRMGVVGFDEIVRPAGTQSFHSDAASFQSDVDAMRTIINSPISGNENGLAAINWALDSGSLGGNFRADAKKIVILITDEDADDFYAPGETSYYDNYPIAFPPGPPMTGPYMGQNDPAAHADPGNLRQDTIDNLISSDATLHTVGLVGGGTVNWINFMGSWFSLGINHYTIQNSPDEDYQLVATAPGVDGGVFTLDTGGAWVSSITGAMLTGGSPWDANFHVGPDSNHTLVANLQTVGSSYLAIDGINLATGDSARNSIEIVDRGMSLLADERAATAHAVQKLNYILNDLSNQQINLASYKSNIEDADIAQEVVAMTINNIVAQTTVAAQIQSQVSPARAMQLINVVNNTRAVDEFNNIFTMT
ncbi:MAG TPA: flagellin [bacterium]|nr:flagellin [bacterium]